MMHNTLTRLKNWSLDAAGVYVMLVQDWPLCSAWAHFLAGAAISAWLS